MQSKCEQMNRKSNLIYSHRSRKRIEKRRCERERGKKEQRKRKKNELIRCCDHY